MSIKAMKLAFESWARPRWTHREDFDQRIKAKPGTYNSFEVQAAWEAWQAALAQQPATGEPVKATPYNPTEEMRWAMKRIDPALSSEQCRALWSAAWSVAPSTHPAPSVPDDVVHLRNALILAANRLDRLTLELKYDSQARADAIEWASDAMLAAK